MTGSAVFESAAKEDAENEEKAHEADWLIFHSELEYLSLSRYKSLAFAFQCTIYLSTKR